MPLSEILVGLLGKDDLLGLNSGNHDESDRHEVQSTKTDENGAYAPKVFFNLVLL